MSIPTAGATVNRTYASLSTPLYLILLAMLWVCRQPPIINAAESSTDLGEIKKLTALKMEYSTPAYREAAVMVMLAEANQVARVLRLLEPLPITKQDITDVYAAPPFASDHARVFGTISTSRYHYFFSQDNKFSGVMRFFGQEGNGYSRYLESLTAKYAMANIAVDTNTAHVLATQWLSAVSIDVQSLEMDSLLEVQVWNPGGGETFVPRYWVRWKQKDTLEDVAMVELLEPERLLLRMEVDKPQYLKSLRLAVTNRDLLLQQTRDPQMQQAWFTTDAYKAAALTAIINEANQLCRDLKLPEKLPFTKADLTEAIVETPFFSDHQGVFAMIGTTNYSFGANTGNKLSAVTKNFRWQDESSYMATLRAKFATPTNLLHRPLWYIGNKFRLLPGDETNYPAALRSMLLAPISQIQDNPAYRLASNFLVAAAVDVPLLERDSWEIQIEPWDLADGKFVPLYKFHFLRGEAEEELATVQVLEPERSLVFLTVEKPEYIKRKPLTIPNRKTLLAPQPTRRSDSR